MSETEVIAQPPDEPKAPPGPSEVANGAAASQEGSREDSKKRSKFIDELGLITQDANVSFLVGAGTSRPGFCANSKIETWLERLDGDESPKAIRARASIYAHFLDGVGKPSKELAEGTPSTSLTQTLDSYQRWLGSLHRLLLRRRDSIRSKRASIFTSNVDLAIEIAGELADVELNDGFSGRFAPTFSTRSFGSVRSLRSWQYEHLSEIPTFDLLKVHGSLDWMPRDSDGTPDSEIRMDARLSLLSEALMAAKNVTEIVTPIDDATKYEELLADKEPTPTQQGKCDEFLVKYEQLRIVNPTRVKFETTLMDHTHYDLLRLFSNELEKENSVLFVLGFSCNDAHITDLIKRAAESNPTLQVFVFPYLPSEVDDITQRIQKDANRNNNIEVVPPFPEEEGKPWEGRWSLTEFSARVIDAIVPELPDEKIQLVGIDTLKELTRARNE